MALSEEPRAGMGVVVKEAFVVFKIMELLSEYQNVDLTKVCKSSPDSLLVVKKTKVGDDDE